MESVQIDIYKEADANMVALAKNVIAKIGKLPSEEDKANAKIESERNQEIP